MSTRDATDAEAAEACAEVAAAGWRWVLAQVRWDDGPWIPESVPHDGGPPDERDGTHSGVGGLALVLAELALARAWTPQEAALADAVATRVRAGLGTTDDCSAFDGLVSAIGTLTALDAPGAEDAVARLAALAGPDGWGQSVLGPPFPDGTRISDATLGTAGVLLGAVWAHRHRVRGAVDLAHHAADVLLAEAEPADAGLLWRFVPLRFLDHVAPEERREMPNWSHGVAGIAGALAVAGAELDRPDLVVAARSGAEHLLSWADTGDGGLVVPRVVPPRPDGPVEVSYGWCHGPTGTALLFEALELAGVEEVAGLAPSAWRRRCLRSVAASGVPQRGEPGSWDNDGRCCGTAGVGDVALDGWQQHGDEADLALARACGAALVERAVVDGPHAWWRFVEHRAAEPLLPPGVGWMQGAAGIVAFLARLARVLREGREAPAVAGLDTWWALPRPVGR